MELRVDDGGVRADRFLAERFPDSSRRALTALFDAGKVRVNGRRARKGQRLEAGDVVALTEAPPRPEDLRPVPEPDRPLVVLHADAALVAAAKPAGVPSHPLARGETGTLANALVARFPEIATAGADAREAGLVQRLDAGTSGVIVAARTRAAWEALRRAFHESRVTKEYLALVVGDVTRPGRIDAPIAHDRAHPGRVIVCEDPEEALRRRALPASTRWEPLARGRGHTLLRCLAETGRMHQVRAHLAHAGHPIAGDDLYGIRTADAPPTAGHVLHATKVTLPHPVTGTPLTIEDPDAAYRAKIEAWLQAR